MQPVIVNVGPHPATLKAPGIARCFEVATMHRRWAETAGLGDGYLLALQCAALGLCWPPGLKWPTTIPPRPYRLGESLQEWGEAIAEAMLVEGLDIGDAVSPAGALAVELCRSKIPKKVVVDAAVGNSEAPTVPSSGASSESAAGGAETSIGGTG